MVAANHPGQSSGFSHIKKSPFHQIPLFNIKQILDLVTPFSYFGNNLLRIPTFSNEAEFRDRYVGMNWTGQFWIQKLFSGAYPWTWTWECTSRSKQTSTLVTPKRSWRRKESTICQGDALNCASVWTLLREQSINPIHHIVLCTLLTLQTPLFI